MSQKISEGDRVVFSRKFLRNTMQFTGPKPFAQGTVWSIYDLGDDLLVATVKWKDGSESKVNTKNLTLANRVHLELV